MSLSSPVISLRDLEVNTPEIRASIVESILNCLKYITLLGEICQVFHRNLISNIVVILEIKGWRECGYTNPSQNGRIYEKRDWPMKNWDQEEQP